MQTTERIITCNHCGSPYCYEVIHDGSIITWSCFSCGFTSNSLMYKDSDTTKSTLERLPEIYKELAEEDKDGFIWVPMYKYVEGLGSIFAEGNSKNDWWWAVAPHIPVPEAEAKFFVNPDGTTRKFKEDMKARKLFAKQDFALTLRHLNII